MGTGSSRLGRRPSRSSSTFISSLVCCVSSSRATLQMENYPEEMLVSSAKRCDLIASETSNSARDYSFVTGSGTGSTSSVTESGASCGHSITASEGSPAEDSVRNIETTDQRKFLFESREELSTQVCDNYCHSEYCRNRCSAEASTSFKEQESSEPVSVILSANKDVVDGIDNSENKGVFQICPEITHPSVSSPEWLGDSPADGMPIQTIVDEAIDIVTPDSVLHRSDVPANAHSRGESLQETIPSGLGSLAADSEQRQGDGGLLHVDVVSISSSISSGSFTDTSGHEGRRNSRRLFWDAFSRRSSRRHFDSPTIVFSTDNNNNNNSSSSSNNNSNNDDDDELLSHDRWLVDFSGDIFDDGIGSDSGLLGRRRLRRQSRSEFFWGRLRDGLDDRGRRTSYCPSGLHPDGTCSCEPFSTTQESSTRESISRIVMLAEALFEVLDEIHRQPASLSLSMMSNPAPEYIVNAFPLKNHKKANRVEGNDDIEQCYICLAEYEEDDKIRVLPCNHEYHMSCVDKWLKEIQGVCPLCRGDVVVIFESTMPSCVTYYL